MRISLPPSPFGISFFSGFRRTLAHYFFASKRGFGKDSTACHKELRVRIRLHDPKQTEDHDQDCHWLGNTHGRLGSILAYMIARRHILRHILRDDMGTERYILQPAHSPLLADLESMLFCRVNARKRRVLCDADYDLPSDGHYGARPVCLIAYLETMGDSKNCKDSHTRYLLPGSNFSLICDLSLEGCHLLMCALSLFTHVHRSFPRTKNKPFDNDCLLLFSGLGIVCSKQRNLYCLDKRCHSSRRKEKGAQKAKATDGHAHCGYRHLSAYAGSPVQRHWDAIQH